MRIGQIANFGRKLKHETVDNLPDLLPAVLLFGFTMWYVPAYHIEPARTPYIYGVRLVDGM